MGEEDLATEVANPVANGTNMPEKIGEVLIEKEENEVKEMEEDKKDDEIVGTEKVDHHSDNKVDNDSKMEKVDENTNDAENVLELEKDELKSAEVEELELEKDELKSAEVEELELEKDEQKSAEVEEPELEKDDKMDENKHEVIEEETDSKENVEPDEKDGVIENEMEKVDEPKEEKDDEREEEEGEEMVDQPKKGEKMEANEVKGSKKRGKEKSGGKKVKDKMNDVEEKIEPTPKTPYVDRPVRERKSVERLVASVERESIREFHIEKGSGTALKDIPNVAFKLSRKKTDETFKLLHPILFGRRGKALLIKSNISRFSGFVWREDEEKQKFKVKEKFEKFNKEKLVEFCDVLDLPVAKTTTRKEDIVSMLIDFLAAPHATNSVLMSENDKSSKGQKRKRGVKQSSPTSVSTPSKRSAKKQKKDGDISNLEEKKSASDSEDDSDEEEKEVKEVNEEENENVAAHKSEHEMLEPSESEKSESEEISEEDVGKRKRRRSANKSTRNKEPAAKSRSKKTTVAKKSSPPPKKAPNKTVSKRSKPDDNSDSSPKVFSRKKKTENVAKEKTPVTNQSASRGRTGKKVVKGKDKPKDEKLNPADNELRDTICDILKEVDFNTATFTDILKQLAKRFDTDLTSRKSSIKVMIQDELTKLADEGDDEEEDDDAEKEKTQTDGKGVVA